MFEALVSAMISPLLDTRYLAIVKAASFVGHLR